MGQTGHLFLSKAYFATLRCEYFSTVNYWLDEYHYSFIANILRIIGSIPFSRGQKWFLRPYFPLIRGMFLLKSGLDFRFRHWQCPNREWGKGYFRPLESSFIMRKSEKNAFFLKTLSIPDFDLLEPNSIYIFVQENQKFTKGNFFLLMHVQDPCEDAKIIALLN